jgi:hypothetical protein
MKIRLVYYMPIVLHLPLFVKLKEDSQPLVDFYIIYNTWKPFVAIAYCLQCMQTFCSYYLLFTMHANPL